MEPGEDFAFRRTDGDIFGDGSGLFPKAPEGRVAAFAVVQVDAGGEVVRGVRALVPAVLQKSAAGAGRRARAGRLEG